jgi:hypothetical protein
MKKPLIVLILAAVLILTFSSGAFAYGGGFGSGQESFCLRDTLEGDELKQFEAVIENFRSKMADLREEMFALREQGDRDGFRALQEKRFEMIEEKREALKQILPGEFAERIPACGRGMRNFGQPRGSGNFKEQ